MNLNDIEDLILENLTNRPFHNLYFIYGIIPSNKKYGGSCSDKVLDLYQTLKSLSIQVKIHNSIINNQEIHRVLLIRLDGIDYFADIGNGWPSIKLFPKSKNIKYTCFGITFSSITKDNCIEIYHEKNGKISLSVIIPFVSKLEKDIMHNIENRFDPTIRYPFLNKIRFSQIIGDSFYFLRDDTLNIYNSKCGKRQIENLLENNLKQTLLTYFKFDLDQFLIDNKKL